MSRYASSSLSTSRRQVLPEVALEAALNQITNSVANLEWEQFFKIFHRHTHVNRFMSRFDPDAFTDLVLRAFPAANALSQNEVLAVQSAKANLIQNLHRLDRVFEQIEAAGLDIGNIRSSLTWLRRHSNETSFELEETTSLHPLYTNTVSASPQCVPSRWAPKQYVGPIGMFPQKTYPSTPVPQSRSPPDASFSAFNVLESRRTASQSIAVSYGASATHRTERKRTLTRPMTVRDDNQHWDPRASVTSYNAREQGRHARGYVNMQNEHEYLYLDASGSRSSTRARWYPD